MDNNNNDFYDKDEHDSNTFDHTDVQKEQTEETNENEHTYKSEKKNRPPIKRESLAD